MSSIRKDRDRKATLLFWIILALTLVAAAVLVVSVLYPEEVLSRVSRLRSPGKQEAAEPVSPARPAGLDMDLFQGARALEETAQFVAIGPRVSGTDGAKRAADHIADRLRKLGIDPVIDEFKDKTPDGEKVFRNVLGEVKGTGDFWVVLLSHYDTKPAVTNFVGANDSGSSTGLLLELARFLRNSVLNGPSILLAFVDGEECINEYGTHDGLHGSRQLARTFVRNMRVHKMVAVIVLDMIGDKDLNVELPRNGSPDLASLVFDSAREENVRLKFSLALTNVTDDHEPFLQTGIRAIDIIDFEYGSAPGKNDYWHTAQDTMDKLSADSLRTVGRVVVRTLNKLVNVKPMMMSNPAR
jgi:hypothetical protein